MPLHVCYSAKSIIVRRRAALWSSVRYRRVPHYRATRATERHCMRTIKIVSRIAVAACTACFAALLLASCGSVQQQTDAAQLNREYMSSVNRISNEASEDLATFSQAASQGDLAAMRIAADDAAETLGKISDLTAPDALKEVHEEYKAGVSDLSTALEQYIELYSSVANGTSSTDSAEQSGESSANTEFDEAALAQVQETYQSGIDHLSKADSMVAEIAGANQSGQNTQGGQAAQSIQNATGDQQQNSDQAQSDGQSSDGGAQDSQA